MKAIFYSRVSRYDLHCENQLIVLREWEKRNQCEKSLFLQEEESTRKSRPVKEQALNLIRSGQYDTFVVTRLDRSARSLQELIMDVEGIINKGSRFISILNGFDFQRNSYNASQQLMLNIFGAFAQFEREIIRERTLEGLARAKAQGKTLGHKKGQKNKPRKTSPQNLGKTSEEDHQNNNMPVFQPSVTQ